MDVNETRRRKARKLAQGLAQGGKKWHPEMSKKMGWSSSLTSQLLGENAVRKITDSRAREIEAAFNLERGWLDQPETTETTGSGDEALLLECLRAVRQEIRNLNLKLSEEDADELLIRATIVLYKFSQANHGELLPASAAIAAARL